MGYYVELRARPGEDMTAEELGRRLLAAGCALHPDHSGPTFLLDLGIVTLNSPDEVKAGN